MASWIRFDTDLPNLDADFADLLKANPVFPWMYMCLLAVAKKAADVDPDSWQGHLVSTSGRSLTVDHLAEFMPSSIRNSRQLTSKLIRTASDLGMLEWDSVRLCYKVTDWFRWFQEPKKTRQTSTQRVREHRQRVAGNATMKRDETRLQTDRQTVQTNNPLTPKGEPGGEDTFGDDLDFEDPVESSEPTPSPEDEVPASSDPSKFSSMLNRRQFRALRSSANQQLQHLSPGGLAASQAQALYAFLETRPPERWPDPPGRWADHLHHFVVQGVEHVKEQLAGRKKHGIGSPVAVAIGKAKAFCAEFVAELEAGVRA